MSGGNGFCESYGWYVEKTTSKLLELTLSVMSAAPKNVMSSDGQFLSESASTKVQFTIGREQIGFHQADRYSPGQAYSFHTAVCFHRRWETCVLSTVVVGKLGLIGVRYYTCRIAKAGTALVTRG